MAVSFVAMIAACVLQDGERAGRRRVPCNAVPHHAFHVDNGGHRRPGVLRMSLATILLIVLVLLLVGALPTWSHSQSWGYFPSGGLSVVVVILIVLLLTGRI